MAKKCLKINENKPSKKTSWQMFIVARLLQPKDGKPKYPSTQN